MAKIEISTIRQAASNLVELNEGYLLYQRQDYEEFEFEIIKIPTLSFIASAIFDDKRVTLHYAHDAKGDCSCHLNGLCRHEVCLFFVLRDKLNEIFKDKKSEEDFFNNAKQDELMQELMEINITRCVNSYQLMPIISIVGSKILLAFDLSSKNQSETMMFRHFYHLLKQNIRLKLTRLLTSLTINTFHQLVKSYLIYAI